MGQGSQHTKPQLGCVHSPAWPRFGNPVGFALLSFLSSSVHTHRLKPDVGLQPVLQPCSHVPVGICSFTFVCRLQGKISCFMALCVCTLCSFSLWLAIQRHCATKPCTIPLSHAASQGQLLLTPSQNGSSMEKSRAAPS